MRGMNGNGNAEHSEREELDDEFPLGDGTADLDAVVECPYCGESIEITLDPGSGTEQDYVEDCEVCCQPWRVVVRYDNAGQADVSVTPLGG
ncbi:MAG TPA: CPXCG motif-containing cysteine-rich protein [Gemmatimonadaceae bacterium]|nr:CPXCG motif-containing cysteine-rich protein [Gemmatimonadaceae bacterium]